MSFSTGLVAAETPSAVAPTALAPTGILRVVINLGNPILARKDAPSGDPVGVSVDLATELANRLKTPLALIPVNSAGNAVDLVTREMADIGFFAIDPTRAKDIAFTQAYLHIDACYVVRKNKGIETAQEIDQGNNRIVVGLGSAYDLFLTRHIQKAELIRAASTQEVMSVFLANGYEVAAGLQHAMSEEVKKHPQLQMLSPPFMAIAQAMGCHPSHSSVVKEGLQTFLDAQATDIKTSIARHGMRGVSAT